MRPLLAAVMTCLALACSSPVRAEPDAPAADMAAPAAQSDTPAPAAAETTTPAAEAAPSAADTAAPAAAEAPPAAAETAAPAASAEADAAYVGTWADDPAQCGKPQDTEDAPMVLGKDRFDQHEAHCTFSSVSGNGNEWKVSSKCSVEGDEQAYDFGLSLADKTLSMIDDAGTHTYTRCE